MAARAGLQSSAYDSGGYGVLRVLHPEGKSSDAEQLVGPWLRFGVSLADVKLQGVLTRPRGLSAARAFYPGSLYSGRKA